MHYLLVDGLVGAKQHCEACDMSIYTGTRVRV
jgi:hypothetical protein